MSLKGRVALITGGGRGIGKGIALALAKDGADAAIIYRRDADAARKTAEEISAFGCRSAIFPADLTDFEQIKIAVRDAVQTFGKIDILVNNAGIASRGNTIMNTDIAELRRVVDTHVFGSFCLTQAVLPVIRQQPRGDIIFISSEAAKHIAPYGGLTAWPNAPWKPWPSPFPRKSGKMASG